MNHDDPDKAVLREQAPFASTLRQGDSTEPTVEELLADRFRVQERVGHGGMGVVYRATDIVLERPVAIKVLRSHIGQNHALVARFFREAKIIAQLSSNPSIVTLYDIGQTASGSPYLVMEYLDGQTLRSVIAAARTSEMRLSRTYVLDIALQIAVALQDAHGAGVIHRDLKPANVVVVKSRVFPHLVKVLDFGIALSIGSPLPREFATETGTFVGTPRYAAPEFFDDQEATSASDMYALGLILYELANNAFPLQAKSFFGWLRAHTSDVPSPFLPADPPYPTMVQELTLSMLDKNPKNRPDARETARILQAAQDQIEQAKRKLWAQD